MQANYTETRRPHVLNRNLTLKDQKEKEKQQKKGNLESNFVKIPYHVSEGYRLDRGLVYGGVTT